MKTRRCFVRIIAVLSAFTISLFVLLNVLTTVGNVSPETILRLQRSNWMLESLLYSLSCAGPISMMLLWGVMFYHWGTHRFRSSGQKKAWFVGLLIGSVLVALVYYVAVFELGRTLKEEGTKIDGIAGEAVESA